MPTVSVIIRAQNGAAFLPACIESVLAQTGVSTELIVVDEGPADRVPEIPVDVAPRIVHLAQEKQGPAPAWNAGMRQASGEYLVFLDADGLLAPGVLASQVDTLAKAPGAGLCVCCNQRVSMGERGQLVPAGERPLFKDNYAIHLCHFNFMPRHAVLLKRSLAERVGTFNTELSVGEDHDYWLRCTAAGFTPVLNRDGLVLCRAHCTGTPDRTLRGYLHNAILHEKVRALLLGHPDFVQGNRPEAWISHAAGCLVTAVRLYKQNRVVCATLFSHAIEAVRQAAKAIALHRGAWNRTSESDNVLAFYVNRALEQLEMLIPAGEKTLVPARDILTRLFPEWSLGEEARERKLHELSGAVCCVQPCITDFATWKREEKALPEVPPAHTETTSSLPRLSIVIATLNAAPFLERALCSIEAQRYANWEILVQDGCSTDGTLHILKCHKKSVSCISEPDRGVYDAWNKAIPRITGEWTLFLGADDFLVNDAVLLQCARYLNRLSPEIVYAYGILAQGKQNCVAHTINRCLHDVYKNLICDMGLPFPATFIRSRFLKRQSFNTQYRIAGDFELAARTVNRRNVARIPVCVSFMELGGLSSDTKFQNLLLQERKIVLRTCVLPRARELVQAVIDSVEVLDREMESLDEA